MNELSLLASSPTAPSPPASLVAENVLRRLFRSWAYIEVRFDVLQPVNEGSSVGLGQTYNVADEVGGFLSLRPDSGNPIAELRFASPIIRAIADVRFDSQVLS